MRSFILSEVLLIVLITVLEQKLAQSTVSEKSDSSNAFIIADNIHSIYIANGKRVLKLHTSEYPIYSVGYSSSTKIIVWCDSNGINYAKLKNPLKPSILLHDKCNAIDVHNNEIYYYSKSKQQIIKINNFTEPKQFIDPIINRSNVLSLKYDPNNYLLFWIEQHNTSGMNKLTQLNLASNTYEQTPKTYSPYQFDRNIYGFPRLFDINYFDRKIYVITQNSYILAINYTDYFGEKGVKVFDVSSDAYGSTLSSISYYKQSLYFYESTQKRITVQRVNEPIARYIIPDIISDFNNHVVSILFIQYFRDIFEDIKPSYDYTQLLTTRQNNSMITTAGHEISTQNIFYSIISNTDDSKSFSCAYILITGSLAIIFTIIVLLTLYTFRNELKLFLSFERNGKNAYKNGVTSDKNESVNFINYQQL